MRNKILFFLAVLSPFFLNAQRLQNQISFFAGLQEQTVVNLGISYSWASGYQNSLFRFVVKTNAIASFVSREDLTTDSSIVSFGDLAAPKFFNIVAGGIIQKGPVFVKLLAGTGIEGEVGVRSKKFVVSTGYRNYKQWNSNKVFSGHRYVHGQNYWNVERVLFKKTQPNGQPIPLWVNRGDLQISLTGLLGGWYYDGKSCAEGSWGQLWTINLTYATPVLKPLQSPGSIFLGLTCIFGE